MRSANEKNSVPAADFVEENAGKPAADPELVSYIEEMIAKQEEAKKAKDFATADAIREELAGKGISIKDTREGTVWELN